MRATRVVGPEHALLVLSVLGILLAPTAASGQTYRTFRAEQERIIARTRWKLGPLRVQPVLQLTNVGYDNNIYAQRRDTGPVSDVTASGGIEVSAYLLLRPWLIFSLVENPEYTFYFEQKTERSLNNLFAGNVRALLFNRFALTGSFETRKARRRATSEFDVRASELRTSAGGQLFYETERQTALGFAASVVRYRYEDVSVPGADLALAHTLNRTETSGSFQGYYLVFAGSQIFLNAGITDYDFEFPDSFWRNSRSHQALVGLRFPDIGPVRGSIALGYKKMTPSEASKTPFSGLIGNATVFVRFGRFAPRAAFIRDCVFSFDVANVYFVESRWSAGLSYYLNTFIRLDYDYTTGRNRYPDPVPVSVPGEGTVPMLRRDNYQTHSFGFVVRIVRSTGVGLQANYWQRDSTIYPSDRSRWFFGGYLTFEF